MVRRATRTRHGTVFGSHGLRLLVAVAVLGLGVPAQPITVDGTTWEAKWIQPDGPAAEFWRVYIARGTGDFVHEQTVDEQHTRITGRGDVQVRVTAVNEVGESPPSNTVELQFKRPGCGG